MRKQILFRMIAWAAVVLWMAVIFGFSAQPAAESSSVSDPFTDAWIALFHPDYDSLPPEEQFNLHESASFIVRKIAHGTVYAVLGILLTSALSLDLPPGKACAFAVPLAVLYAVSDEFHQTLVPGRSGQIRDVLIDTGGALAGTLLTAAVIRITKSCRKGKRPRG